MSCRPRLSVRGMMILVAVVLLMLGIGALTISAREAAIQAGCAYNLRNIGLALHNYHSSFESFPPATIPRPGLPPEKRLSWCVLIYSFADQFFWDLDWNESWDSPRNRVTRGHGVEETPSIQAHCRVFECPKSPLGDEKHMPGWTSYVAIAGVGPDAPRLPKGHPRAGVFGHNRTTSMSEVSDGLSQTMMIVETTRNLGPWTAGGPSTLRGVDPKTRPYLGPDRPFGGLHRGGTLMAMADGSARFVPDSTDPKVFEAMATISGGEPLTLPGTTAP